MDIISDKFNSRDIEGDMHDAFQKKEDIGLLSSEFQILRVIIAWSGGVAQAMTSMGVDLKISIG